MLRVFVRPDNPGKDFVIEHNLLPSGPRPAVLPVENFGNMLQSIPSDSPAELAPRLEDTMKCEQQLQMGSHMTVDGQCCLPNRDPLRQDTQTGAAQYGNWPTMCFSTFESGKGNLPDVFRGRSTSQSPHQTMHHVADQPSPDCQFKVEALSPINVREPTPGLIHPVPRHSPYTVTSYFAPSEKLTETLSPSDLTGPSHDDRVPDNNRSLLQCAEWTSNGLAYQCLLRDRASPDTSSATTATENYTTTDSTLSDSLALPWSSLRQQEPWDAQTRDASRGGTDESTWTGTRLYSSVDQSRRFDQLPVPHEDYHGLPWSGTGHQAYVQPSSLIDPYKSTCSAFRSHDEETVADTDRSQIQCFAEPIVFQNGPRTEDTTDSPFEGDCARHASRIVPWSTDTRNAFLIECKRRGLSYKDIKRIGGFKEAESTLRGRFRTLTKSKEQRVRKPQWQEKDIKLLCEAVNACSETGISSYRSRRQPPKISWKKVAQYIWAHGGSYHFGNATCKKKWCEVQNRRI